MKWKGQKPKGLNSKCLKPREPELKGLKPIEWKPIYLIVKGFKQIRTKSLLTKKSRRPSAFKYLSLTPKKLKY